MSVFNADNGQVIPGGCVPWRSTGMFHMPGSIRAALRTEADSPSPETPVDGIQGSHEFFVPDFLFVGHGYVQQVSLPPGLIVQVKKHDSCLGV